ncbi:GTP-binding protein [Falcatimonas sp. MSJ-15]|uniref:GTP-binding protein n=1 Tax=Falcatimonas sp. MSJ-15 TaxID=2841515 RepID=UPI001C10D520|nr:GTP-binding protein [Falcatimonas sp. MSJ-15]MBU5469925.1 GTP-binding protein [Falcatimonas sp. MSJ-15]
MVKIDLITGFLGSGKTTFIKKYAKYLMDKGENIGILENDFGAVNVDMMLLQELEGDKCELEMVSGGCDVDCHRRRFKTKLIAMAMCGYDRVIVEPSGIYDVDEFFDTLHEEPLDKWYKIDNVITLVNASLESELSEASRYLLASQASVAGSIILTRLEEAGIDQAKDTVKRIKDALIECKCNRDIDDAVIYKETLSLTNEDFDKISTSGYNMSSYKKTWSQDESGFESIYFLNKTLTVKQFEDKTNMMMNNTEYGNVFRVKGFLHNEDGTWIEVNATRKDMTITPIAKGQEVIIVIGEGLNKELIEKMF